MAENFLCCCMQLKDRCHCGLVIEAFRAGKRRFRENRLSGCLEYACAPVQWKKEIKPQP